MTVKHQKRINDLAALKISTKRKAKSNTRVKKQRKDVENNNDGSPLPRLTPESPSFGVKKSDRKNMTKLIEHKRSSTLGSNFYDKFSIKIVNFTFKLLFI